MRYQGPSKTHLALKRDGCTSSRLYPDAIDFKILSELQGNARLRTCQIAAKVGLTAPSTLRRIQALQRAGFISRFWARLDAKLLGFNVEAFIQVGLKRQNQQDIAAFEAFVRRWSLVREAYIMQGEFDFLLKCVTQDAGEVNRFLDSQLMAIPNVREICTSFVVRTQSKSAIAIP